MTEISEQKMTLDLPTLLVGRQVTTVEPGMEQTGCVAIPGTMTVGCRLRCPADDPSQVTLDLRVLDSHYDPPAGCSPKVLEICHRVNQALAEGLSPQ